LTIPCCKACNNEYLSSLEQIISPAVEQGYDEFKKLPSDTIFLWLAKLYFGLIYKHLYLYANIRNPSAGNIVTEDDMKDFFMHHLYLQGIRRKHESIDFNPYSIFIFKLDKAHTFNWDFIYEHQSYFLVLRMGDIGVISLLQDGGATSFLKKALSKYDNIVLSESNFKEIAAFIFYHFTLLENKPATMSNYIENEDCAKTYLLNKNSLTFRDWVDSEFIEIKSALFNN
jgi:hypothetical protein